ncbi:MAG: metallopeptidase family protein [SAR202 cluster bacterium]|nr:metallopeptidase family protein [SAR202 cluster bacterium]
MRLTRSQFILLVQQAYRQLPPQVRRALRNVDVVVEDQPSRQDMSDLRLEGTLFGLYHGVPLTQREGGGPTLPDRIAIYRLPILASCSTPAEVVRQVRITLWHEVGHYLGLGEDDLRRLGYG